MTTENRLEALFVREAHAAGAIALKVAPTHVGAPDRAVIKADGSIHLVELKTETGRLRPAQIAFHHKILRLTGVVVLVLRGADEIRAFFRHA